MSSPAAPFLSRADLLRRREGLGFSPRRLAALGGVFLGGLAATLWLRGRLAEAEADFQMLALAAGALVAVPVAVVALGFVAVRDHRHSQPVCPHCAREIWFDLALATHRCGWCGERVIQDELPAGRAVSPSVPLPPRPELAQRLNRAWAEANRFGLVLIVALFGGIVGFLPFADWMERHAVPIWGHVTLGVLLLAFLGLLAGAAAWQLRRAAHRLGLYCPACRASLLLERRGNLAIATGRCPCCGAAVAAEDGVAATNPQPTAKRFWSASIAVYLALLTPMKAYEEVIEFIAAGPSSARVAEFTASPQTHARVAALLQRRNTTGLSPEETLELDDFMQLEHLMRLVKARARAHLQHG